MLISDQELLRPISDEINFVLETTENKNQKEVFSNGILFRAIIRSIEIIG